MNEGIEPGTRTAYAYCVRVLGTRTGYAYYVRVRVRVLEIGQTGGEGGEEEEEKNKWHVCWDLAVTNLNK